MRHPTIVRRAHSRQRSYMQLIFSPRKSQDLTHKQNINPAGTEAPNKSKRHATNYTSHSASRQQEDPESPLPSHTESPNSQPGEAVSAPQPARTEGDRHSVASMALRYRPMNRSWTHHRRHSRSSNKHVDSTAPPPQARPSKQRGLSGEAVRSG